MHLLHCKRQRLRHSPGQDFGTVCGVRVREGTMLLDSLLSSCPTFRHFPHFPQMDCALSGADSLMGGLMCVLGSSPMDSPVRLGVSATAATSIGFYSQKFRGFNFLCWNSGLCGLSHSPVVPPSISVHECRIFRQASHHLAHPRPPSATLT